jgi:hypothetical protein
VACIVTYACRYKAGNVRPHPSPLDGKRLLEGRPMSEQRDEHIKTLIEHHTAQRRRERDIDDLADMAEANRRARLLQSPKRPLPDVPLHKRGFGVMEREGP